MRNLCGMHCLRVEQRTTSKVSKGRTTTERLRILSPTLSRAFPVSLVYKGIAKSMQNSYHLTQECIRIPCGVIRCHGKEDGSHKMRHSSPTPPSTTLGQTFDPMVVGWAFAESMFCLSVLARVIAAASLSWFLVSCHLLVQLVEAQRAKHPILTAASVGSSA